VSPFEEKDVEDEEEEILYEDDPNLESIELT